MNGLSLPPANLSAEDANFKSQIARHMLLSLGKPIDQAQICDWRIAVSLALRDHIVTPWLEAREKAAEAGLKTVHYLSMEFLIGRILEDAAVNLGLYDDIARALADFGQDAKTVFEDEPDPALGNGGLGRLAACFMESMATVGCPAYGHGIRYDHGLFRQDFEAGLQVEHPDDWRGAVNPWEFARPDIRYHIGFKGHVETKDGKSIWYPAESVWAEVADMPVIGWQGKWADTLRLWVPKAVQGFDLARFNRGDYAAAASDEIMARTLGRVLYPDDTSYQGKELRLKQEFFLTSAALQNIIGQFLAKGGDLRRLSDSVAIQMNDTHPAIAGAELIRLLMDDNGIPFEEALGISQACLGYTNHTLLPEALERWATFTFGNVLPRHMQIIEMIDAWHLAKNPSRPRYVGIVKHQEVRMGELAFIMSHKVNGVSALHSELVQKNLFAELDTLHPGRIINQTNGVTPRRWLKMANRPLAGLITQTIGTGWEDNLNLLSGLETHVDDPAFQTAFDAAKRQNKVEVSNWIGQSLGVKISPDALFDVQVKRIHEYKRQLLNILETIAYWHKLRSGQISNPVARVKIFGGKAAPGYVVAKEIIRLINDVAKVINNDPKVGDLLKVVYPPNYNVSMAERLVPAADLSEQISTAGKEASGTGNMKFMMNGAPTIGTLDGANVEILQEVGEENFFLFGLTAQEVMQRRQEPEHERKAIAASQELQDVLQIIAEGTFSPDDKSRYHGIVHGVWHHDYFLVSSDFASYHQTQALVDAAYTDRKRWLHMAAMNTARSGFFSSDRTIRGYMSDVWGIRSALN